MRGRPVLAGTLLIGACLLFTTVADAAESSAVATAGGASVSVATAPDGGSTIVVNSDRPCRVVSGGEGRVVASTGSSTSIVTGQGGLSGSASISPNGSTVTIRPGAAMSGNSAATGAGTAGSGAAGTGECVIVINAPAAPPATPH